MTRNEKLRQICRSYLKKLRKVAYKRGLRDWIKQTIELTKDEKCKPTESEVKYGIKICKFEYFFVTL